MIRAFASGAKGLSGSGLTVVRAQWNTNRLPPARGSEEDLPTDTLLCAVQTFEKHAL